MIQTVFLSRKYARALMKHFRWHERDSDWVERIAAVADFLYRYRRHFFNAPRNLYDTVMHRFDLQDDDIATALTLLEQQQRLVLLPEILRAVVAFYQQDHGYEECMVSSAQPLTSQQKKELQEELERVVDKKLHCSYKLDAALIAGIKVRGQSFAWEDSIASRLHTLEQVSNVE